MAAAVVVASTVFVGCGGDDVSESERDRAVAAAKEAFRAAQVAFVDLERGPCIAERLPGLRGWVVDVAHDPRRPIDDVPANQCRRFREGEANHFVELDPRGNLIRAE